MTFLQARGAMRDGVFAHFDADIAAPHLVRDRGGSARAKKGVENKVAGIGGDVKDAVKSVFRVLACQSCISSPKRSYSPLLGFSLCPTSSCGHHDHRNQASCLRKKLFPSRNAVPVLAEIDAIFLYQLVVLGARFLSSNLRAAGE